MKRIIYLCLMLAVFAVTASATQITISSVQIQHTNFPNGAVKLRLYSSDTWTDTEGSTHLSGIAGQTTGAYQEVSCTASSGTVVCPDFVTPSTVNSIDRPQVRITGWLFSANNARRQALFASWIIPSAPTTLPWKSLVAVNNAKQRPFVDSFLTAQQTIALFSSAQFANPATTTTRGVMKVSVSAADPVAVETTDPRFTTLSATDATLTAALAAEATTRAGAVTTLTNNLNTHTASTTSVHGIADTSQLVVTSDPRLISNQKAFNVKDYGALGSGRISRKGSSTASSAIITCSDCNFASADVGKIIRVDQAGTALGTKFREVVSTIASVQSSTQATMATTAGRTASSLRVTIGTSDDTAIQNAVNAAAATGGGVYVPAGTYLINDIIATGKLAFFRGDGASTIFVRDGQANSGGLTGVRWQRLGLAHLHRYGKMPGCFCPIWRTLLSRLRSVKRCLALGWRAVFLLFDVPSLRSIPS